LVGGWDRGGGGVRGAHGTGGPLGDQVAASRVDVRRTATAALVGLVHQGMAKHNKVTPQPIPPIKGGGPAAHGHTSSKQRSKQKRGSTGEEASFFFQRFDANGSGDLNIQEFGEMLLDQGLFKPGRLPTGSHAVKHHKHKLEDSHEIMVRTRIRDEAPLSKELEERWALLYDQFLLIDTDRDGVLSFTEFRNFWDSTVIPSRHFEKLYTMRPGVIGRGAFGSVRRGTQLASGREVAVKYVRSDSSELNEIIHTELTIWEGLKHPHLLELLDVHEIESVRGVAWCGVAWLVLAFLAWRGLGCFGAPVPQELLVFIGVAWPCST
jgi:hypothetical protein